MNNPIRYIFLFVGLVLFQVLVLNNINVSGLVNPYIYPLFILLLPFEIAGWALLILAFFTGLGIDIFMGTIGMHAFSTVFLAMLRPTVINFFSQRNTEHTKSPSINDHGFSWMLIYVLILIFMHHIAYFFIEAGTFTNFLDTLLRVLCSTGCSIFLIFMFLYAFRKVKKK